ncbi:hypothetical protein [Rhizobium leguminosarum]|uniref:hypothetical protein n=1 Tax=Rhizobium leguminosarum TaxID=384 RepID=UPI003F96870B
MTRASFRQADIERIIRAAEKTGAAVQVDLKSLIVTIFPGAGIAPRPAAPLALQPDGNEDWADLVTGVIDNRQYRKPEAKPRFGERIKAAAVAEPKEGPGGYPIIDDPDHPLKQWYDQLGFDPRTMEREDMERLQAKAHADWAASIPGTPLGKREIKALKFLSVKGPNVKIHFRDMRDCGLETGDRLKIRGFLETFPQEEYPDRTGYYMLTKAGLDAWQQQAAR